MDKNRHICRGKRIDSGVWVKGYYVYLSECNLHIIIGLDGQYNTIDPETLGECSTLPDMYENLVFEGDIVTTGETNICGEQRCFPVIYSKGSFWLYDKYLNDNDGLDFLASYYKGVIEIVGNKWDNSELLKGDDNNG